MDQSSASSLGRIVGRVIAVMVVAAIIGCARAAPRTSGSSSDEAVAGCYDGTGLRISSDTARSALRPVLVLDSVAETGATRFHARVVLDTTARAALWGRGPFDTVQVAVSGAYPMAVYTLVRSGDRLVGTAQAVATVPGTAVDTTPRPVHLTRTPCAPVLARLGGEVSGRAIPAAVRAELAAMDTADQALRKSATAASFRDTAYVRRLVRGDSARTERLETIIAQWGWPAPSRAGEPAASGAFLVLQHSPSAEFQRRMLPALDSLARVGEASGEHVALLTDLVLKREGEPQRYGNQFDFKGGRIVLNPIADSAHVDARRAALGLMPLADYVRMLSALYHAPVGAAAEPQTQSWKTYADTARGYAFRYPPGYTVEGTPGDVYLVRGKLRTEIYVENWTRAVTQRGVPWHIDSLAADRASGACMTDGGACSTSCTVRETHQAANAQGIPIVTVRRELVSTCAPGKPRTLPPVYVAALARRGTYELLIVMPRLGARGVPDDIVRSVVATVRYLTP